MIVLGVLLVAIAAVAGTEVVLSNTQTTTGEAFDQTVTGMSAGEFFLAGAAFALVLVTGLLMIFGGITRTRRRRIESRHAVVRKQREVESTVDELAEVAEENERLRRELAAERLNRDTMGGVAVPPDLADSRFEPYPGMETQALPEPVQPVEEREKTKTRRI